MRATKTIPNVGEEIIRGAVYFRTITFTTTIEKSSQVEPNYAKKMFRPSLVNNPRFVSHANEFFSTKKKSIFIVNLIKNESISCLYKQNRVKR